MRLTSSDRRTAVGGLLLVFSWLVGMAALNAGEESVGRRLPAAVIFLVACACLLAAHELVMQHSRFLRIFAGVLAGFWTITLILGGVASIRSAYRDWFAWACLFMVVAVLVVGHHRRTRRGIRPLQTGRSSTPGKP